MNTKKNRKHTHKKTMFTLYILCEFKKNFIDVTINLNSSRYGFGVFVCVAVKLHIAGRTAIVIIQTFDGYKLMLSGIKSNISTVEGYSSISI